MSQSKQPVRVGFLGAGNIAEAHLSAMGPDVDVEAVAIADVNETLASERASKHGIPNVYTDYRKLLENPNVDAVVVGLPNFLHAPVSIEAMQAGKDVLCEKPMAIDVDDATKMVETANSTGRTLMVAQNYRYQPEMRALKNLIEQGRLGDIYLVKVGWFRRKGIPGWGSWFTQKEKSGGGCLIDIGVHMLDVAWYLMGSPKPLTVSGSTFSAFGPQKRGLGGWGYRDESGFFDVDDAASAFLRFEGASALTLDVSWALNQPDRMWLEVMGDRAGATALDGPLTIYEEVDGETRQWQPEVEQYDGRKELLNHFAHCCRTKERPISPAEDGLEMTRMLTGIYRSSDQSEEIAL